MHSKDFMCPDCPHDGQEAQDTARPKRRAHPTPDQVEGVKAHFINEARKAKAERLVAHITAKKLTARQVARWNQQRWIVEAKAAKVNYPSTTTQALVRELLDSAVSA